MSDQKPAIYGLLGSKISYSLSPEIFRILFRKFDLPHGYFLFDIHPECFWEFLESAALLNVAGFNVTIPFKNDITPHLDRIDQCGKRCKSVNLVLRKRNKLVGYNTDVFGISEVLRQNRAPDIKGKHALLIGAGGTARTMLAYLIRKKVGRVSIVNRSRKRLNEMLSDCGYFDSFHNVEAYPLPKLSSVMDSISVDMIFNATPIATEQIVVQHALKDADFVFEAAYNAGDRNLPRGVKPIGGIDMLIFQALRSFEIFTDVRIGNYRRLKSFIKGRIDR